MVVARSNRTARSLSPRQATKLPPVAPPAGGFLARSFPHGDDRADAGTERGEILATLHGELGTILNWTERQTVGNTTKNNTPGARLAGVSVSMVAGACFNLCPNFPRSLPVFGINEVEDAEQLAA